MRVFEDSDFILTVKLSVSEVSLILHSSILKTWNMESEKTEEAKSDPPSLTTSKITNEREDVHTLTAPETSAKPLKRKYTITEKVLASRPARDKALAEARARKKESSQTRSLAPPTQSLPPPQESEEDSDSSQEIIYVKKPQKKKKKQKIVVYSSSDDDYSDGPSKEILSRRLRQLEEQMNRRNRFTRNFDYSKY